MKEVEGPVTEGQVRGRTGKETEKRQENEGESEGRDVDAGRGRRVRGEGAREHGLKEG